MFVKISRNIACLNTECTASSARISRVVVIWRMETASASLNPRRTSTRHHESLVNPGIKKLTLTVFCQWSQVHFPTINKGL